MSAWVDSLTLKPQFIVNATLPPAAGHAPEHPGPAGQTGHCSHLCLVFVAHCKYWISNEVNILYGATALQDSFHPEFYGNINIFVTSFVFLRILRNHLQSKF